MPTPYNESQISQGVINIIHQDQYESITPTVNEFYLVKDGNEFEITDNLVNSFNTLVPIGTNSINQYYPSAKLVYDTITNNALNADTKYY